MSDTTQGGVRPAPPSPVLSSRQELRALTGLRALAAFWVVLFHLRHQFLFAFPETGFWLRAPLVSGYLGVDLFFVLSGFVISYCYADTLAKFSWQRYLAFLWARLCRIYPVHLFALITVLVLSTGLVEGVHFAKSSNSSTEAFVENLLMTHAWALPVVKTWNYPAWSISSEWFAYLFFPAFLVLTLRLRKPSAAALFTFALLAGAGLLYWLTEYRNHSAYAMVRIVVGFSLGCILWHLYRAGTGADMPWGVIVPTCFAGTIVAATMWHASALRPIVWAPLTLAAVVYGLAWGNGVLARWLGRPFMVYWGRLSYSLYMTHWICLHVIESYWPSQNLVGTDLATRAGRVALTVAAILAATAATYHLVEEPLRWRLRRLWPAAAPRARTA